MTVGTAEATAKYTTSVFEKLFQFCYILLQITGIYMIQSGKFTLHIIQVLVKNIQGHIYLKCH